MQVKNLRWTTYCLITAIMLLGTTGCKKTDYQKGDVPKPDTKHTTADWYAYAPMNVKFSVGREDENGVIHPVNRGSARTTNSCASRDYLVTLTYKGYTATRTSPHTTYDVTHEWTVEVPSDDMTVLSSTGSNKGRQSHINAIGSWSAWTDVAYTLSGPTSFTTVDPYYSTTVNMSRYTVRYTITMTESAFCNAESYRTYPRVRTDCDDLSPITPVNPVTGTVYHQANFTPDTYIVYEWGGFDNSSNPSLDQLDLFPLIVTPAPCHQGSLGTTPTHKVYYRKQGVSTWTSFTTSSLSTTTVNVTATGSGVYEIQSQGIITTGVYSPLSPIRVATVY